MKTTQDVWAWIFDDDDDRAEPEPSADAPARAPDLSVLAPVVAEPEPPPAPPRVRPRRALRRAWVRRARFAALLLVAALAGAVGAHVFPSGRDTARRDLPAAAPTEQRVVTWTVRDPGGGGAYVAVLGSGGSPPPVAMPVPAEVTVEVPGQGLGTIADAAAADATLAAVAVENLLGVRVDGTAVSTLRELARATETHGVEVAGRDMDRGQLRAYLSHRDAEIRFLRWQDVLQAILEAAPSRPALLVSLPEEVRPMLRGSAGEPPDLLALPVIDVGSGVLRADPEATERLVAQRFAARSQGDDVRLVVLNGVGTPGIGEDIARILVPEGFRVVTSGNARTFDMKITRIVASSREDLPAAQRARRFLGVGKVLLGNQPAGLADVTVVVGADFGGS